MPSAASVKFDRQFNQENALADSSQNLTPLRQAITIIEHKIRNLEKRKSKLESYKELQNAGKELNADQKTAVAKFTEVISTLDFARDLCKQFVGIATVSEKEAKKTAKKEAALKYQCELARLREILLVQDALNQMGNENVRDDFLNGRHGAANLTETDLKLLDDFYPAVTPKHEAGNPLTFTNEVQAAAEHLLAAVDGKQKEVFGGSYSHIKEILGKIHESGYFDRVHYEVEGFVDGEGLGDVEAANLTEPVLDQEVMVSPQDQPVPPVQAQAPLSTPMPPIENLTIESRLATGVVPPEMNMTTQVEHPIMPPEHVYYQQQMAPPPPQVQQPPRPITEMLSTGSFFFLQESEIDPLPDPIPSQTFTNQSFGSHPVPLPPHFGSMPNNLPSNNHQVTQMTVGNNGIDDNLMSTEEPLQLKENAASGLNRGPPRPTNNQSYYQNNGNNYNRSRPNQNRNVNGPRPVSTRH